jgi:phenylacetate-CoA ligase
MNLALLRRHIFEPLLLMRSRSPKLAYCRQLEKTQYYSRQQLEEIQWNRLKELWQFLWQHNDFYRQRFIDIGLNEHDLKTSDDIRRLPILTKKEIRNQGHDMISSGFQKESLFHFKTGGSTGKALDIFITEECSEMRNACAIRHDRWTGWEPGEPIGAVWGNPKLPKTFREKIIDAFVQPFIYLDTMAVTDDSVRQFVELWKKRRPTLLFGHAHSLYILAQQLEKIGIKEIRPTGIIATSMMLLAHERAVIEKVLTCKVTDRYGCEEVSLIGCECEKHNGMHMNIEHLIIEFIKEDGSYATPGESGRIVVTDLMNKAMPFVRYQVEDVGVPLNRDCSCGRGLPLMGKVTGRVADFLLKSDGTKVAGISLIENTLTRIPAIDQMQIIQKGYERFDLNIVPGAIYNNDIGEALIASFKDVFDENTQIHLQLVSEIPPEKSGKYRFSICEIKNDRSDSMGSH